MKQAHARQAMQKIALTTLAVMSLAQPLWAAGANPQNQAIEEIEVIGRSASRLRMEIERIEEGMFALFNELNSTDDFDVACRNSVRLGTGSRIPIRECEPAYLTKARAANAYDFVSSGGALLQKSDAELMFENRAKTEQLNVEIRELALEHPELATAMLELDAKKQSLMERESGACGTNAASLVCSKK
jgi:hypothetical protein